MRHWRKFAETVFEKHPIFGIEIPTECPNVPTEILNPINTWESPEAYTEKAKYLEGLFEEITKNMLVSHSSIN
jgi:phosphoenolpyruvate carboxykinase (ATP)